MFCVEQYVCERSSARAETLRLSRASPMACALKGSILCSFIIGVKGMLGSGGPRKNIESGLCLAIELVRSSCRWSSCCDAGMCDTGSAWRSRWWPGGLWRLGRGRGSSSSNSDVLAVVMSTARQTRVVLYRLEGVKRGLVQQDFPVIATATVVN